jgi:hypothetical protein
MKDNEAQTPAISEIIGEYVDKIEVLTTETES